MAPTFPFTGLDTVEVFAVEDTVAQIVWRGLRGNVFGVIVDGTHIPLGDAAHAGAGEVTGLRPDTTHRVDITIDGCVIERLDITTTPALDGPELTRVATISDLHFGEEGFGLLKPMRERPRAAVGYPMRCARAAVREAVAWGAQLLVIKGDITESGRPAHWELVDEFLAEVPIPVMAIPGNHDVVHRRGALHATTEFRRRGLFLEPLGTLDVPGARIIAADTTVEHHSWGHLRRHREELMDAIDVDTPALLFIHHHLEQRRIPLFWPLGSPRRDWRPTIDSLLGGNPDLLVSSGHTHRNRAHRHGSAVLTEVSSTKDHPGVWAGYVIHPGGVRQVVRRVADPASLAWNDRTHAAVGGIWGQWSPGRLADRSFIHRWIRPSAPTYSPAVGSQLSEAPSARV